MRQNNVLRCLVPLLGLALLVTFAVLYTTDYRAYYRALNSIGVPSFTYPFIDWEAIGADIKCWNEGIDVYVTNPCDVLNRLHDYSPLFLRLTFITADKSWTVPIGLVFILIFLSSLFWLIKAANWREMIIFALACTSPMVIYGLERGNFDIIVFIMLVVAGMLGIGPLPNRLISYVLILLVGLLKFYPLVVLSTALRERPRTFVAVSAVAALIIVGFFYSFRDELTATWKNISPGAFGFGSRYLPFYGPLRVVRLFPGLEEVAWFTAVPYVIMAALLIFTAVQALQLARNNNLVFAFAEMPERDAIFLIIGAALVVGCFFAGQSDNYRGVHLIFVIVGLVAMRHVTDNPAIFAMLTRIIMAIIFLMWATVFNVWLHSDQPGLGFAFYSLVREILWWRLVAFLLAILVTFGAKSKLFGELQQWRGLRVHWTKS
jgi:hypothetical protein